MERKLLAPGSVAFPEPFRHLTGYDIYDSSCSAQARVYFIDAENGFFLKCSPKGTLEREAAMTRYFHEKGMGAPVLSYESLDCDWLLTKRVAGEDCTHAMYKADPKRLCDVTAELLRRLHDTDLSGCPVPDRTAEYLARARQNHAAKLYDADLFPDNWGYATPEQAWRVVEENGKYLKSDTLLHGDYCLPNIMLDNWNFSGFIDLDTAGVGDRHVDLFWGIWSLWFNLKTDALRERFLDVYGRQDVNEDLLHVIAAIEVFI